MNREFLICQCETTEHQIVFCYDNEDDPPVVYLEVHLNPEKSIFQRVIHAIKYIFGYRCKYGDFDSFIFKQEDRYKLEKVLRYLKS